MKTYNSAEELLEAIASHKNKEEVKETIKALVAFAIRDKTLDIKSFPPDSFAGSILISALMLSVKNM